MAVSKRLRFEVLRRDEHTCQYCGETAPSVTLHVDHVVPVALGGTDNPGNLVAACKDCNSGKTSVPSDAPLIQKVNAHAAAYALTLTDKMTRIREELYRNGEYIEEFLDLWNAWKGVESKQAVPLPSDYKDSLRRWCAMGVPIDLLEYAIEVAMTKKGLQSDEYRYMAGVIWRTLDEQETPYNLTAENAAVYTQMEADEKRIEAYEQGWRVGFDSARYKYAPGEEA